MPRIDLNADVGEGEETDEALIPLVTSVNVACGAHAGDPDTMQHTLEAGCAPRRRGGGASGVPGP